MINELKKSCCFTGYRPDKFPFPLEYENEEFTEFENSLVETVFTLAAEEDCLTFYSGMAMGFDIIAAETVLLLKKKNRNVRLICALPFSEQGSGFSLEWKNRHREILSKADEVIAVSSEYSITAYHKRNAFMVNRSDFVVTWFDGKSGGTQSTLQYAAKKGRHIINLNKGFKSGGQMFLDI